MMSIKLVHVQKRVVPIFLLMVGISATILSYLFLDKGLALICAITRRDPKWFHVFDTMQCIAGHYLVYVVSLLVIFLTVMLVIGKSISRFYKFLFCFAVSDCVAIFIGNGLKFIFGRYWPETFMNNNLSFIKDGAYGFTFFNIHREYQSFPSTHCAAIFAVMTVVWIYYPKCRIVSVLPCIAVIIGLLGCNYHFLSDIIAGITLGVTAAFFTNSYVSSASDSLQQKQIK